MLFSPLPDLFAQNYPVTTSTDPAQIVQDGAVAAEAIKQAMDGLWQDVLNGGLYAAIAKLGVFFGVGTLLLFMVQWYKDLMDGDNPRAFAEIIWPVIVIVLLSNQAAALKGCTLQLREIINVTNQSLLASTSGSMRLEEAYRQVTNRDSAAGTAQAIMGQCTRIADPQQQQQCIDSAVQNAQKLKNAVGDNQNTVDSFLDSINPLNRIQNEIGLIVRGWLMAMGIAFQWVVEISLLLTALLGPLAVGSSLLPVGQKSIYTWLIGFFSVGMVKLSYNIIVGLVATIMLNADRNDPLIFACIVGLLAPVLALVLAAGGGMAVFNSLSSLAMSAATSGINLAAFRMNSSGAAVGGSVARGLAEGPSQSLPSRATGTID